MGYQKLARYHHRDAFEREWVGDYDDRKRNFICSKCSRLNDQGYISSWDGKISKLVVQAIDEIYDEQLTSTYRRTYVRNISPMFLRLANWPFNHVDPNANDGKPTSEGMTSRLTSYSKADAPIDMPMLCVKWFLASIVMVFVVR